MGAAMEPRIQYAQTTDGVSIAFYTMGEGMPLVYMPPAGISIETEWQIPGCLQWIERLAEKRKIIRYDPREFVLSEGEAARWSLETPMLDLEAVVGRLGLDRFALYATMSVGPLAITYTAHHPERVSHLILGHCFARGADIRKTPQVEGLMALVEKDWVLFTETYVRVGWGWSAGEPARLAAVSMRERATPEGMLAVFEALTELDVTDLLSQVRSPTLVLHRRQVSVPPVAVSKSLASQIPDARLVLLEGESQIPYIGDPEAIYQAIDEFLSEGEEAETESEGLSAAIVHTILFTDVEGSTALIQRLGDAKARELLREHERLVREALKAHGGSEVKTLGDGFMASFSSATKALECAIAMQRAFAAHNESAQQPILVRIGLNAGEPIAEDDDLFGTAVNRAARITARAKGGEILVSNVVRELAEGKDFLFADRAEANLKGFDESVRLFEVRWEKDA